MIFISTGGIRDKTAAETAQEFHRHGIPAVELSGGAYAATLEADLLAMRRDLVFQVHNYFPPPAQPFVFNLASFDREISERSVQHVRSAMQLAITLGRPVYSFHAGFRINPVVSELGGAIKRRELSERSAALDHFGERMLLLAEEARREGVTLLVENNVLSAANMATFGEDPLLLTHPDEIAAFMRRMPAHVGLLLDVAHLKVSARTLGFDLLAAHAHVKPWIRGYHLSDNDGLADSNNGVTADSWFWDVIDPGLDYYSLEIYRMPVTDLVRQHDFVKASLTGKNISGKVSS